jgi:hypothetical protein
MRRWRREDEWRNGRRSWGGVGTKEGGVTGWMKHGRELSLHSFSSENHTSSRGSRELRELASEDATQHTAPRTTGFTLAPADFLPFLLQPLPLEIC